METLECTVRTLYEIRAQLLGLMVRDEKTKETTTLHPGFVNEKGLTERVKRLAYKAGRVINAELEGIDTQRQKLYSDPIEGVSEEEAVKKREARNQELLNDKVKLSLEKLDFSTVESLSLANNYSLLYEHIFTNY